MGDKITMSEALMITVTSMIVVFAVLALIAWMIGLLKNVGKESVKKQLETPKKEEEELLVSDEIQGEVEYDEDLIAVISAAIVASMGLKIPNINITSIKRINQNTSAWREMSKQEHFYGKL
ncbi:MAG: OadG family protein [Tissierellia bacterium]|nr:OadG family protein [Tissierellia bacterium]